MVDYNLSLDGKTILVTGAAGFIGSNLVKRLFNDAENIKVIGIDSINDYYDVNIKYERLKENLLDFVTILQEELIRSSVLPEDYDFEAHKELVPMQPGDVPVTYADTTPLERDFGYKPDTSLRVGLRKFAEWYKGYVSILD